MIIKEYKTKKVTELLAESVSNRAHPHEVLIVFWHGLGDILMFLPLYDRLVLLYPETTFRLGVQPGLDHTVLHADAVELTEEHFLDDHGLACVINFPMSEGNNNITKAEYCCKVELGIRPPDDLTLHPIEPRYSKFVGVHLQGTCLPGATNPDENTAKRIWSDIIEAGCIPIEINFEHTFHNPYNKQYPWVKRSTRDMKPSMNTLLDAIASCKAFVGVASGPFVASAAMRPESTIYLQKSHDVNCYMKDFKNVIDLNNYDSTAFINMIREITIPKLPLYFLEMMDDEEILRIDTEGSVGGVVCPSAQLHIQSDEPTKLTDSDEPTNTPSLSLSDQKIWCSGTGVPCSNLYKECNTCMIGLSGGMPSNFGAEEEIITEPTKLTDPDTPEDLPMSVDSSGYLEVDTDVPAKLGTTIPDEDIGDVVKMNNAVKDALFNDKPRNMCEEIQDALITDKVANIGVGGFGAVQSINQKDVDDVLKITVPRDQELNLIKTNMPPMMPDLGTCRFCSAELSFKYKIELTRHYTEGHVCPGCGKINLDDYKRS